MPRPQTPPFPEQMPVPLIEVAPPQAADTVEQLELPEGFKAVRSGGTWLAPMDRRGQLRQVGDAWWDSTWVDGRAVWMMCTMTERGLRCLKPTEWKSRKECGAYDPDDRAWCTQPVGTCKHCVDWSASRGQTCAREKIGRITKRCGIHRTRSGKIGQMAKIESYEDLKETSFYADTLDEAQRILYNAAQGVDRTNLEPEIDLLRSKLADLNIRYQEGETESAWMELTVATRRLRTAKGEKDRQRAIDDIIDIVENGSCRVAHEREIANLESKIVATVKANEDIKRIKEQSISTDHAIALLSAVVAAAADTWKTDILRLKEFKAKVASVAMPNIPIEVKVLE
jgi:hypothetical protein